jgi:hypothetical protein
MGPAPRPAIRRLTMTRSELHRILDDYFSASELRSLCFDLGVDHDDLPGDGQEAHARELVAFLERRGRLAELEAACRRLRPGALAPSAKAPWHSKTLLVNTALIAVALVNILLRFATDQGVSLRKPTDASS